MISARVDSKTSSMHRSSYRITQMTQTHPPPKHSHKPNSSRPTSSPKRRKSTAASLLLLRRKKPSSPSSRPSRRRTPPRRTYDTSLPSLPPSLPPPNNPQSIDSSPALSSITIIACLQLVYTASKPVLTHSISLPPSLPPSLLTHRPTKSSLITARWRLVYTTSESILGKTRPAVFRPVGPIYQYIDLAKGTARYEERKEEGRKI